MTMMIAIPSMGRSDRLVTLKNFASLKSQRKVVMVVPPTEVNRYTSAVKYLGARPDGSPWAEVVAPPADVKGIAATRHWILHHLSAERGAKYTLMLDDDMDFCYREKSCEPKLLTVTTLAQLEEMLLTLEEWLVDGFVHVGISARQGNNNKSLDPAGQNYGLHDYRDATRMMNAYAYNVEKLHELNVYGRTPVMEDFDLTLQLLRKGFPNRVLFHYCWNQRGSSAKGGCSSYRTAEVQAKAAHMLAEFHPGLVKVVVKKSKDSSTSWKDMKERTDVTVKWREAFAESGKKLEGAK